MKKKKTQAFATVDHDVLLLGKNGKDQKIHCEFTGIH